MRLKTLDDDVYRLCLAGYVGSEICELLDLSEEGLRSALERLGEYLAPTPPSKRSIDLSDCVPFGDEW